MLAAFMGCRMGNIHLNEAIHSNIERPIPRYDLASLGVSHTIQQTEFLEIPKMQHVWKPIWSKILHSWKADVSMILDFSCSQKSRALEKSMFRKVKHLQLSMHRLFEKLKYLNLTVLKKCMSNKWNIHLVGFLELCVIRGASIRCAKD